MFEAHTAMLSTTIFYVRAPPDLNSRSRVFARSPEKELGANTPFVLRPCTSNSAVWTSECTTAGNKGDVVVEFDTAIDTGEAPFAGTASAGLVGSAVYSNTRVIIGFDASHSASDLSNYLLDYMMSTTAQRDLSAWTTLMFAIGKVAAVAFQPLRVAQHIAAAIPGPGPAGVVNVVVPFECVCALTMLLGNATSKSHAGWSGPPRWYNTVLASLNSDQSKWTQEIKSTRGRELLHQYLVSGVRFAVSASMDDASEGGDGSTVNMYHWLKLHELFINIPNVRYDRRAQTKQAYLATTSAMMQAIESEHAHITSRQLPSAFDYHSNFNEYELFEDGGQQRFSGLGRRSRQTMPRIDDNEYGRVADKELRRFRGASNRSRQNRQRGQMNFVHAGGGQRLYAAATAAGSIDYSSVRSRLICASRHAPSYDALVEFAMQANVMLTRRSDFEDTYLAEIAEYLSTCRADWVAAVDWGRDVQLADFAAFVRTLPPADAARHSMNVLTLLHGGGDGSAANAASFYFARTTSDMQPLMHLFEIASACEHDNYNTSVLRTDASKSVVACANKWITARHAAHSGQEQGYAKLLPADVVRQLNQLLNIPLLAANAGKVTDKVFIKQGDHLRVINTLCRQALQEIRATQKPLAQALSSYVSGLVRLMGADYYNTQPGSDRTHAVLNCIANACDEKRDQCAQAHLCLFAHGFLSSVLDTKNLLRSMLPNAGAVDVAVQLAKSASTNPATSTSATPTSAAASTSATSTSAAMASQVNSLCGPLCGLLQNMKAVLQVLFSDSVEVSWLKEAFVAGPSAKATTTSTATAPDSVVHPNLKRCVVAVTGVSEAQAETDVARLVAVQSGVADVYKRFHRCDYFLKTFCNSGDSMFAVPTDVRVSQRHLADAVRFVAKNNCTANDFAKAGTSIKLIETGVPQIESVYDLRRLRLFHVVWQHASSFVMRFCLQPPPKRDLNSSNIDTALQTWLAAADTWLETTVRLWLKESSYNTSNAALQMWLADAKTWLETAVCQWAIESSTSTSSALQTWLQKAKTRLDTAVSQWSLTGSKNNANTWLGEAKTWLDTAVRQWVCDSSDMVCTSVVVGAKQDVNAWPSGALPSFVVSTVLVPLALEMYEHVRLASLESRVTVGTLECTLGEAYDSYRAYNAADEIAALLALGSDKQHQQQQQARNTRAENHARMTSTTLQLYMRLRTIRASLPYAGSVYNTLFGTSKSDKTAELCVHTSAALQKLWTNKSNTLHDVVKTVGRSEVMHLLKSLDDNHVNLLGMLGQAPDLLSWLMQIKSQNALDDKIRVARGLGRVNDPDMIRAVESLKRLFAQLSAALFFKNDKTCTSYAAWLAYFSAEVKVDHTCLDDARFLHSCSSRLMTALDTNSSAHAADGALKDLLDIHKHGYFAVTLAQQASSSSATAYCGGDCARLTVELTGESSKSWDAAALVDLRARLLLAIDETATTTTVDAGDGNVNAANDEQDEVLGKTQRLATAFARHLEVLEQMTGLISKLSDAGHNTYKPGYRYKLQFSSARSAADLALLPRYFSDLLCTWQAAVNTCRDTWPCLNFFSTKALWVFHAALKNAWQSTPDFLTADHYLRAAVPVHMRGKVHDLFASVVAEIKTSKTAMTNKNNKNKSKKRKNRTNSVASSNQKASSSSSSSSSPSPCSSAVELLRVLVDQRVDEHAPETALDSLGAFFAQMLRLSSTASVLHANGISKVPSTVQNATDDLTTTAMMGDSQPVWVATAHQAGSDLGSSATLDMALSLYVRRGRLPLPGEVVVCDTTTPAELVELLIRRFSAALNQDQAVADSTSGDSVFCVVNIDKLPSHAQLQVCAFLDHVLQKQQQQQQHKPAALRNNKHHTSLVFVARKQCPVVNAWAAHSIMILPLSPQVLREKCAEVLCKNSSSSRNSYTAVQAVRSALPGGGKTEFIMSACREGMVYARVNVRESTSNAEVVGALLASDLARHTGKAKKEAQAPPTSPPNMVLHVSLSHIVPSTMASAAFQLTFCGALEDYRTGRVFCTSSCDSVYVEVPNNPPCKLNFAFCRLLPGFDHVLDFSADAFNIDARPSLVPYNEKGESDRDDTDDDSTCFSVTFGEAPYLRYVARMLKYLDDGGFNLPLAKDFDGLYSYDLNADDSAGNEEHDDENFDKQGDFIKSSEKEPKTAWQTMTTQDCFKVLLAHCCGLNCSSSVGRYTETAKVASEEELSDSRRQIAWTQINLFAARFYTTLYPFITNSNYKHWCKLMREEPDDLEDFRSALVASAAYTARTSAKSNVPRADNGQRLVDRVNSLASWESCKGPIFVCTPKLATYTVSLSQEAANRAIKPATCAAIARRFGYDVIKVWSELDSTDDFAIYTNFISMLTNCTTPKDPPAGSLPYVLTVDNMYKMLSLATRILCGIPTVVMGESGCGKSSLLVEMCRLIGAEIRVTILHGGVSEAELTQWLRKQLAEFYVWKRENDEENAKLRLKYKGDPYEFSNKYVERRFVVFLDEVNACDCMGLIKEVVVEGLLDGKKLPAELAVVAACNPYRRRPVTADMAGGYLTRLPRGQLRQIAQNQQNNMNLDNDNDNDGRGFEMEGLVYRVVPLPESLMRYVIDYGALSAANEARYIKPKVQAALSAAACTRLEAEAAAVRERAIKLIERVSETQRTKSASDQYAELNEQQKAAYEAAAVHIHKLRKARFQCIVDVLSSMVCAAQEYVRATVGDRSAASVRDVTRCLQIFNWARKFLVESDANSSLVASSTSNSGITVEGVEMLRFSARRVAQTALASSITFAYGIRLNNDQRAGLRRAVVESQRTLLQLYEVAAAQWMQDFPLYRGRVGEDVACQVINSHFDVLKTIVSQRCSLDWLQFTEESFAAHADKLQNLITDKMAVGKGIALNAALRENICAIVVSVLNNIPLIIVGVPGSSKTLAVRIVERNLRGKASATPFLARLPAVELVPYQCSPRTTSEGIENAFEQAKQLAQSMQLPSSEFKVIVFLDEVGLAEFSEHKPLKVVHKQLDESNGTQPLIGVSNWPLDPAKMNRAVMLFRPAPSATDLALTAMGITSGASLRPRLRELAAAYHAVVASIQRQERRPGVVGGSRAGFWGLRDFYALIKWLDQVAEQQRRQDEPEDLTPSAVLHGVQRNFGGRPHNEFMAVARLFFKEVGSQTSLESLALIPERELVCENIRSNEEARHLMVVTENAPTAMYALMMDTGVLPRERTDLFIGSDFPADRTDVHMIIMLQRIKWCMEKGRVAVIMHAPTGLYEALYDLLNQNYIGHGEQLFVRLAFGATQSLCSLSPNFRVVAIVQASEAYTKLAPPLLNRFEKQVLSRKHMLSSDPSCAVVLETARRVARFARAFATCSSGTEKASSDAAAAADAVVAGAARAETETAALVAAFAGYTDDMILSAAQVVHVATTSAASSTCQSDVKDKVKNAIVLLLECATPEAVCRWCSDQNKQVSDSITAEFDVSVQDTYFNHQVHASLSEFVAAYLALFATDNGNSSSSNKVQQQQLVMVMTHAPRHHNIAAVVRQKLNQRPKDNAAAAPVVCELDLNLVASETDLRAFVAQSLRASETQAASEVLMLVTAEIGTVSHARLLQAQHTVDSVLAAHNQQCATHQQRRPCNVVVMFVVHAVRGNSKRAHPRVEYNCRWKHVFVDAVGTQNQMQSSESSFCLPDYQHLLLSSSRLMSRLLEKSQHNMFQLFCSEAQPALALLKVQNRLPNYYDDALRALQNIDPRVDFATLASDSVMKVCKNEKLAVSFDRLPPRGSSGTFQVHLHQQMMRCVRRAVSVVLAHMHRNYNLHLVVVSTAAIASSPKSTAALKTAAAAAAETLPGSSSDEILAAWTALFQKSIDMHIAKQGLCAGSSSSAHQFVVVDVPCDTKQLNFSFAARFPFSFEVSRLVESLKTVHLAAVTEPGSVLTAVAAALRAQVESAHNLHFSTETTSTSPTAAMSRAMIDRYFDDFVCMHVVGNDNTQLALAHVKRITRAFLQTAFGSGEPWLHVSDIHVCFWAVAPYLQSTLRVVSALPQHRHAGIADAIFNLQQAPPLVASSSTRSATTTTTAAVHALVAGVVVHVMNVVSSCCTDAAELSGAALNAMISDLVDVSELVDAVRVPELKASLVCCWDKIALACAFVQSVVQVVEDAHGAAEASVLRCEFCTALQLAASATSPANCSSQNHELTHVASYECCAGIIRVVGSIADERSSISSLLPRPLIRTAAARFLDTYMCEFVLSETQPASCAISSSSSSSLSAKEQDSRVMQVVVDHMLANQQQLELSSSGDNDTVEDAATKTVQQSSCALIMQALLSSATGPMSDLVNDMIQTAIASKLGNSSSNMQEQTRLDMPLGVAYVTAHQAIIKHRFQTATSSNSFDEVEAAAAEFEASGLRALQNPLQASSQTTMVVAGVRETLDAIAFGRALCYEAACALARASSNVASSAVDSVARVLDKCFACSTPEPSLYIQSLQLYFLNNVVWRVGLSELRRLLKTPALARSLWLTKLLRCNVAVPHFSTWITQGSMPSFNPLMTDEALNSARRDFVHMLTNSSISSSGGGGSKQSQAIRGMLQVSWFADNKNLADVAGKLLLATFYECFPRCLVGKASISADAANAIDVVCNQLAAAHGTLPQVARSLLVYMTTFSNNAGADAQPHQLVEEPAAPKRARVTRTAAAKLLVKTPEQKHSNTDNSKDELNHIVDVLSIDKSVLDVSHVMQIRFLVHLVAVATKPQPSLASVFGTFASSPGALQTGFWPQMAPDQLYYLMANTVHSYGRRRGRWFYCRNGHAYMIDACGRPTEILKCTECGCKTGGLSHKQIEYVAKADGGWHELGVPGHYDASLAQDAPSSSSSHSEGEVLRDRDVDPRLQGNTNYFLESEPQDRSPPGYSLGFSDLGDLSVPSVSDSVRGLSALACRAQRLMLHAALYLGAAFGGETWAAQMRACTHKEDVIPLDCDNLKNFFYARFRHDWARLKACLSVHASNDDVSMYLHAALTKLAAVNWDQPFTTRQNRDKWEAAAAQHTANLDLSRVQQARAECADDSQTCVASMLDSGCRLISGYAVAQNVVPCDLLFAHSEAFTTEALHQAVVHERSRVPLLYAFFDDARELRAAHHLADVLDWTQELVSMFDRRITSDDANETKVSDVLPKVHRTAAWKGFEQAWKQGLHLGVGIECGTVTPSKMPLSTDSAIGLCMPSSQDQGLLSKALITVLVRVHERFRALSRARLLQQHNRHNAALFYNNSNHLDDAGNSEDDEDDNENDDGLAAYPANRDNVPMRVVVVGGNHQPDPHAAQNAGNGENNNNNDDNNNDDNNNNDDEDDATPVVSSRAVLAKHVVFAQVHGYDNALQKLEVAVQRRFMSVRDNGSLVFDLAAIEKYVATEFFANMPRIRLEVASVHYANENAASEALGILRARVVQVPLSLSVENSVRRRVTTVSKAQACIEKLEQALAVNADVLAAAAGLVGDTKLSSLLLLRSDCFADVCVKHADAVHALLSSLVDSSEFAAVNDKYKVPLSSNDAARLNEASVSIMQAANSAEKLQAIANVAAEFAGNYLKAMSSVVVRTVLC